MNRTVAITAAWTGFALLLFSQPAFPASGYTRTAFAHWADPDGNGRNAREDSLARSVVVKPVWACPYTGTIIDNPGLLDIDHIVPLKWAWDHGANRWTDEQRMEFANDPENLVPVLASANRAKGSKGPNQWLPPLASYRAAYVARFNRIRTKYGLK